MSQGLSSSAYDVVMKPRFSDQGNLRSHVLFVAGAGFFSGAERALLVTARALMEAGHPVMVACGTKSEMLAQLQAHGVPSEHVPVETTDLKRAHRVAKSIGQLVRLARRHRASVIHANEAQS